MFHIDTRQDLARSDCTDGLSDWMNESVLFINNKLKNFHLLFYVSRIICVTVLCAFVFVLVKVGCRYTFLLKPHFGSRNCRYLGLGSCKTTNFLGNVMAKTIIAHKREFLCCCEPKFLVPKRTWG